MHFASTEGVSCKPKTRYTLCSLLMHQRIRGEFKYTAKLSNLKQYILIINLETLKDFTQHLKFHFAIIHFTVTFSHLHFKVIQRGFDTIPANNNKTASNCLIYTLDYVIMQLKKHLPWKKQLVVSKAGLISRHQHNTDVFFWRNFQSNFLGKSYFTSPPILYIYMFTHSIV